MKKNYYNTCMKNIEMIFFRTPIILHARFVAEISYALKFLSFCWLVNMI